MNKSSLRKQFFGGVCAKCISSPKFSLKSLLLLLLSVLQFSLPVLIFAADSPTKNPSIGTETTPKDAKPSELSTYKSQVGDSFVVTVDGYPD